MRTALTSTILFTFVLGWAGVASANAMAPWSPCNDLEEGDRCIQEPYYNGYCEVDTDCEDAEETDEDECLVCVNSGPGNCSMVAFHPTTLTLAGQLGVGMLAALVCLRRAARRRSS
jgi:hypothetical protein